MALDSLLDLNREVFGINVYSASPAVIEIAANWGLDFVFIDTEHSVMGVDSTLERLILASRAAKIAPLVRVPDSDPVSLRKTVEMGAEGVIVPQVRTATEVVDIVESVKFPPLGKRGGDGSVRSAVYASRDFDWADYVRRENQRCKVIPMAESVDFFDHIDDIIAVPGIDAIHFGPADFALSRGCKVDYSLDIPEIREAVELLTAKCSENAIKVMLGCSPANRSKLDALRQLGASMFLMGNDMAFIDQGCAKASDLAGLREEKADVQGSH